MKKYNLKTVLSLFIVMLFAQVNYGQTVTIGTQVWTSKNLNVSTYRNGDVIPEVQDKQAWAKLTTGAWCYYNNDASNGTKYGKLYNWYAVNDPRGLAPNGYHIPTDAEWTQLSDYLGGESKAGTKMKSTSGWESYTTGDSKTCPNCASWNEEYRKKVPCHTCKDKRSVSAPTVTHSGNGSNSSGFSGLPGGHRYFKGAFFNIGTSGFWWSSTENFTYFAWYRYLEYYNGFVSRKDDGKGNGFSVRCLRD